MLQCCTGTTICCVKAGCSVSCDAKTAYLLRTAALAPLLKSAFTTCTASTHGNSARWGGPPWHNSDSCLGQMQAPGLVSQCSCSCAVAVHSCAQGLQQEEVHTARL